VENKESSPKTADDDDMQDEKTMTTVTDLLGSMTDHSTDISEEKQHRDRKIVKRMLEQIEDLQRKAQQKLTSVATSWNDQDKMVQQEEQELKMVNNEDTAATSSVAVYTTPIVPQNIEESIVVIRHGPAIPAIKRNGTTAVNSVVSAAAPSSLVGEKSDLIRSVGNSIHKTFSPLGVGVLGGALGQKQITEARQQPKPPKVEAALQERYAAIPNVGDRAYQILLDLGMVGQE
jgi:hypothetical protein